MQAPLFDPRPKKRFQRLLFSSLPPSSLEGVKEAEALSLSALVGPFSPVPLVFLASWPQVHPRQNLVPLEQQTYFGFWAKTYFKPILGFGPKPILNLF